MPASFAGVGGRREARVLAIAWRSRRHILPRPEFLLLLLPLSPVGRALERAREAGAAVTGLRADLVCGAGPRLPT